MDNKKSKKYITILVSVLLLVCCTVGGVIAYLVDETEAITNTFTPTTLETPIDEDFKNNVKENVKITNTGNVEAFVRAKVIITWKKEGKNGAPDEVLSVEPVKGVDYAITYGTDGWIQGIDGFLYYQTAVAPNGATSNLIDKCEVLKDAPADGYTLSVEILASSIQAKPDTVVQEAWGVTIKDGSVTEYER